jgi:hypothetical protein
MSEIFCLDLKTSSETGGVIGNSDITSLGGETSKRPVILLCNI